MSTATNPQRLEAILRTMVDTVGAGFDQGAWLDERGLAAVDRDAFRRADPRGVGAYGKLVRGTLESAIRLELSRTILLLEHLGFDVAGEIAAYLSAALPSSHYLRDVAFEFFAYVEPRWRAGAVPALAVDLARYELAEFEVRCHEARSSTDPATPDLALDRGVVFNPTARVVNFEHRVHTVSDEPIVSGAPLPWSEAEDPQPTSLLLHRDEANDVCWFELDEEQLPMLGKLLDGAPLGVAVASAAGAEPVTPALVERASAFLAELASSGALLGGAPLARSAGSDPT
ncbi:MAG: hypothetical protein U0271_46970 [Polyangiaceae bacterium]